MPNMHFDTLLGSVKENPSLGSVTENPLLGSVTENPLLGFVKANDQFCSRAINSS